MERDQLLNLTDEELLLEKRKLKNSRIFHAAWIGFLAGIVIFGFVSWSLSPDRKLGFLIPIFFPIFFIYRMLKNPKKNTGLEEVLRERGLS